jgi:quercetin dioxygenase-like cupin family protein
MEALDYTIVPNEAAVSQMPEPGMIRQVLAHNSKLMLVRHFFEEGWVGARHRHPHEQLVYVVRGRLHVEMAGTIFEIGEGGSFVVEGDVDHQASALQASEVLDVFTPVRADYQPK